MKLNLTTKAYGKSLPCLPVSVFICFQFFTPPNFSLCLRKPHPRIRGTLPPTLSHIGVAATPRCAICIFQRFGHTGHWRNQKSITSLGTTSRNGWCKNLEDILSDPVEGKSSHLTNQYSFNGFVIN